MHRWRLFGLFIGLLLGQTTLQAQRDFSKVEIQAVHVAGNVYALEGAGGKIGVSVGEDGILIVDDQFAPLADKIRAALKTLGEGKLRFILNTHWHGDHTGGNPEFGPEAPIIAHTNVRKRLMQEHKRGHRTIPPMKKEGLPVLTFDSSLSIHFNGEEIRAIHFPHGHTDGDLIIFFTGSNVVHMGDVFFAGRFPFVDLDSGGDVEGLIQNVAAIIRQLPEEVEIIPGHGPISTLTDLNHYLTMLRETTAHVRRQMAAGKSLSAIQQAGLPEKWEPWSWGFISTERWIEIVYRSYRKASPSAGN